MNRNRVLLDTNIVLYLLAGRQTIYDILLEHQLYLSFVSQLELLGYRNISKDEELKINKFIADCILININEEIKLNFIAIRKQNNVKLADGIIAATSQYLNIPLLTADKTFKNIPNLSLVLYNE